MNRMILPAVLAFALSGSLALAQAPDQAPAPTTPPPAHHLPTPQKQVAHLTKQLNLTPDQQAKLEPIFADHDQKLAALNTSTTPPDKKQRHALEQDLHTQLATVLTPDQLEQMKSMHHKGKGAPQTIPPPQAPSV